MGLAVTKITGPAYWASALINGDESGLSDEESAQLAQWCELKAPWYIVSVVEDSESFTWSYQAHNPFADCAGGEVVDYIAHRQTRRYKARSKLQYGDKRDYPKINIYARHDGRSDYLCSTTWARTCREAEEQYSQKYDTNPANVTIYARFAK